MAPILAALLGTLAQNGLGLLATAIQVKGKEVVEQALGTKLPENPAPEDLVKLRQLQFDHEERLMQLSLDEEKLSQEVFRMEMQDRQGARDRDAWFVRVGLHNWRADIMFVLAVGVICWLVWIVWKDSDLNEYVKGIFTLVLGRFLGYLDNIYNFEFGTTRGSRGKDDTIKNLTGEPK